MKYSGKNEKGADISADSLHSKKYLAGVAAPASLLAHRARGCNEIYHLKYFLNSLLSFI